MTEHDVLNAYTRVKFHFDPKSKTTYKSTEHYPSKTIESNRKYIDLYFLMKLDIQRCTLFFVWLFYSKNVKLSKRNTRTLYESEQFKKFKELLYNYPETLEKEFVTAYNIKSFDVYKQTLYKGKLSSITLWVLLNTRFKENKHEILESNVFSNIWFNIDSLIKFINLDKDIIKDYIRRIEEWV